MVEPKLWTLAKNVDLKFIGPEVPEKSPEPSIFTTHRCNYDDVLEKEQPDVLVLFEVQIIFFLFWLSICMGKHPQNFFFVCIWVLKFSVFLASWNKKYKHWFLNFPLLHLWRCLQVKICPVHHLSNSLI